MSSCVHVHALLVVYLDHSSLLHTPTCTQPPISLHTNSQATRANIPAEVCCPLPNQPSLPPSTSFPTFIPAHIRSLLILRPMIAERSRADSLSGRILVNPPQISRAHTLSHPSFAPSFPAFLPPFLLSTLPFSRACPFSLGLTPTNVQPGIASFLHSSIESFLHSSIHTRTHTHAHTFSLALSLIPSLVYSPPPSLLAPLSPTMATYAQARSCDGPGHR